MTVNDEDFEDELDSNLELSSAFPVEELKEKFATNNQEIARYVKIKKFKFALDTVQREELLSVARSHSFLHELMIRTQMLTGLRVGELVNLRIEDVFLGAKTIQVNAHEPDKKVKAWKPKTFAGSRIIPVNQALVTSLSGYIQGEKRKTGYFFISRKHSAFRIQSVIGFINKYACEAKSIKHNIGSHALRRTFASYMLAENIPIGDISHMLGHSSIQITLRYLYQIDTLEGFDKVREIQEKMVGKS